MLVWWAYISFLTAGAHSLDTACAAPDGGRPSSLPLALFPSARPIPTSLLYSPAGEAPPPAPTTYLLPCRTCSPSCAHLPCSTGRRALRRRVCGTATPAPSTFPMPAMAGHAAARRPWQRQSGEDVRRQRGGVVEQALELHRLQDLLQCLEISGGLHDATLAEAALDLAVGAAGRRVVVLRGLQEHLVRVEAAAPLERARAPRIQRPQHRRLRGRCQRRRRRPLHQWQEQQHRPLEEGRVDELEVRRVRRHALGGRPPERGRARGAGVGIVPRRLAVRQRVEAHEPRDDAGRPVVVARAAPWPAVLAWGLLGGGGVQWG
ncbi:hypothetical protein PVAP13_9NG205719 [Panicum virgatum]|uniref:Uncharacterized protein n=1 Tax=Panicum virgatum TaxID=38727 RepID=A0A8T0MGZ2_PANVG|nr:hypothetical protein PVAP13_9NG205719 [Panicum virgatum]